MDKSAPAGFLDPKEGAAVQKEGKFRVSLYKALLFLQTGDAALSFLILEFGQSARQVRTVSAYATLNGLESRAKRNPSGAFMDVLKDDWKPPKPKETPKRRSSVT